MKTAEEYLNSKGFYITNVLTNAYREEVKISDMLRDYATEAIKADRERVRDKIKMHQAIYVSKGFYHLAENLIKDLPIELP